MCGAGFEAFGVLELRLHPRVRIRTTAFVELSPTV
jgi:hypothetical protein